MVIYYVINLYIFNDLTRGHEEVKVTPIFKLIPPSRVNIKITSIKSLRSKKDEYNSIKLPNN